MSELQEKWQEAALAEDCDNFIMPRGCDEQVYYETGKSEAEEILNMVENPELKTFLDYGAGTGRVAVHIAEVAKRVYCADFSDGMLEKIDNKKVPNIKTVIVKNNKFLIPIVDVAYSISVFIHNTHANGLEMLKNIANNVKPGGLLLLQIPVYDIANEPKGWIDVGVWDIKLLLEGAKNAGCEVIECYKSPGAFSYHHIGVNHHKFQILRKL